MHTLGQSDMPIGEWLRTMLSQGVQRNVVIVALANKLAHINLGGATEKATLRVVLWLCGKLSDWLPGAQPAMFASGMEMA
ncbi:hypothetical protein ACQZ5N_10835 [Agrobacterium sp. 22-221-1]|nr:hypothetical protein FY137_25240 [Agrobacterium tumefaciens]